MRACARVEKRGCAVKVGLGRKTKTVTVDGDVRASAMEPAHEAGGARVLGAESEGRAGKEDADAQWEVAGETCLIKGW